MAGTPGTPNPQTLTTPCSIQALFNFVEQLKADFGGNEPPKSSKVTTTTTSLVVTG